MSPTAGANRAGPRSSASVDARVEGVPTASGSVPAGRPADLPPGLRLVRRTPVFTTTSMPAGLRREHRTSVWAQLVVVAGVVVFRDEDPADPRSIEAHAGDVVTIAPDRPHSVAPSEDAELYLRFYERAPAPTTEPAR